MKIHSQSLQHQKQDCSTKVGLQYNNIGGKDIGVVNDNYVEGGITVQICDNVNKFLVAVSQIG